MEYNTGFKYLGVNLQIKTGTFQFQMVSDYCTTQRHKVIIKILVDKCILPDITYFFILFYSQFKKILNKDPSIYTEFRKFTFKLI